MAENYNMALSIEDPIYTHSWYYGLDKDGRMTTGHALMDPAERKRYGRLYTYLAAESIAPEGWRLPTGEELEALLANYGGLAYAATALREGGESGLDMPLGGVYASPFMSPMPEFSYQEEGGYYWYLHDGEDPENEFINLLSLWPDQGAVYFVLTWPWAASVRYVREIQE